MNCLKKSTFIVFVLISVLCFNVSIKSNNSEIKRSNFFKPRSTELAPEFKEIIDKKAQKYALYAFKKFITGENIQNAQIILDEKVSKFLVKFYTPEINTILSTPEINEIHSNLLRKTLNAYLEVFSKYIDQQNPLETID